MHRSFLLVLVVAAVLVQLVACGGNNEDVTLRLTANERTQIDTLFTQRVEVLRPQLDSICENQYDAMVKQALDSIIQERLEEEARLRARIPIEPN